MIRVISTLFLAMGLIGLGGCSASPPTYDDVRAEAEEVLKQATDLVPEPKQIVPTVGIPPYSCSDRLLLGETEGNIYTGQWAVFVDDAFDVPAFVNWLPDAIGGGWREDDLGAPVDFAQVRLVRDSPYTSLTVEERTVDGRKAIDFLAISRCGTLPATPAP